MSMIGMSIFSLSAYAVANYDTYTPHSGYFNCYSENNEDYAGVYFVWDNSMMGEFNASNDTYEQDVVFYNYDGNAYATGASAYQTNLPEGYLDTQLSSFVLMANYRGPAKTKTRTINSLYIHTWASVEIESVTIVSTINQNGEIEYYIETKISDVKKTWQLPSNVAFNF